MDGGTQILPWLSNYASSATVKEYSNPSFSQIIKALKDGCVAVIHVHHYIGNGHYMAVLDINDKNEVYLSNPDIYAKSEKTSTKLQRMDKI